MFCEALKEVRLNGKVWIDHENCKNYLDGKEFNLIFPLRLLKLIKENCDFNKKINYNFCGKLTDKREWVKEYDQMENAVAFTQKGRLLEKGFFDLDYYQILCNSHFTLCPEGDYKWSYRFFEAILCDSIPVIKSADYHSSMDGFKFFTHEEKDQHTYSKAICDHNKLLFLRKNSLLGYLYHI